jgi:hypothetical protein
MHYIWSKNLDAATTAVTNWNEQQVCDIRVRVQGFGFTDARCLLLFLCLVTALGDSRCRLRSDFICCIDAIGDLSESWAFLVPSAVFVLCTRKYGQGAWPWLYPLTLTLTLKHVTWRVFRKLRRSWPWRPCVSWASRGRGEPVAPGCLVDRWAKWCYRLSLAWLEQGLLWSTRLLKRMRQIEALEAEHEESCNYEMEFANGLGSEQGFHLHISRLPSQDAFVLLPWDQHLANVLQQQHCTIVVTKAVQISSFCRSLGIHECVACTHFQASTLCGFFAQNRAIWGDMYPIENMII